MGPNGSGKSTLSSTLAGREEYEVTAGNILFKDKDISDFESHERAGGRAFFLPSSIRLKFLGG